MRAFLLEYHPHTQDACLQADHIVPSQMYAGPRECWIPCLLSPGVLSPWGEKRAGNAVSVQGHKHQGWGLMCRPRDSNGRLADYYIPISAAPSSLGAQELNQLKV